MLVLSKVWYLSGSGCFLAIFGVIGSASSSGTWMFGSRSSSVSEGFGCELTVCSHIWEKSNEDHKQSAYCNMNESVNIMSEDLVISSFDVKDSFIAPVVDLNSRESVGTEGNNEQISLLQVASDQDNTLNSNEINICQEISQSLKLDANAKVQKHLSKCKTFPESREMQACFLATNGRAADSQGTRAQGHDSSASGSSAYSRSISLPSSSTLVSAMKGGRAQNGTMVKLDMRVKWAPEVYDPPFTSMPHTVNRHQRTKAKKKDKHKHKGKPSRGNGGDRKRGNRKNINNTPDPQNVRLQANSDRLVPDGFGKSKVGDIFDYGINDQEGKCGTSFLRESLPKVHLPIGEAS